MRKTNQLRHRRVCGDIPVAVCVNKVDEVPKDANLLKVVAKFRLAMRVAKKNNAVCVESLPGKMFNLIRIANVRSDVLRDVKLGQIRYS
jgi:GTPase Era involved in 16S rRNA processing